MLRLTLFSTTPSQNQNSTASASFCNVPRRAIWHSGSCSEMAVQRVWTSFVLGLFILSTQAAWLARPGLMTIFTVPHQLSPLHSQKKFIFTDKLVVNISFNKGLNNHCLLACNINPLYNVDTYRKYRNIITTWSWLLLSDRRFTLRLIMALQTVKLENLGL